MIRPFNLSESFKYSELGTGTQVISCKSIPVRVTNLLGTSVPFRGNQTNCFLFFSKFLEEIEGKREIHIVDLHAETTSEKNAFLWAFNGQVSAILGTHTHVPTNDCVITPEGTAYITDVGMTGPAQGVIGGERTGIIQKFFYPERGFILEPQSGPAQLCSVLMEFDEESLKPISIEPIIIREGFKYDRYSPKSTD
ncbi:metallophosphoesterase YmdB [Candidatus Mycoplasma haematolamae str. Purdue]|uniref:Metallophosphoesterase YmdB n=1 Tax=Mycoplasma haematolamae (strain Purdue) TaxID=1212765 RepID=I7CKV3_MYCHA|nr:metallophosphoesterase YmdB [Candidatus Mycoplasma haematolamae str. Purdue]